MLTHEARERDVIKAMKRLARMNIFTAKAIMIRVEQG